MITQTAGESDNYRWSAPEMLIEDATMSAKGDLYSFGMTILEVRPDVLFFHVRILILLQLFTHEVPYANIKRKIQLLFRKEHGLLPDRPQGEQVIKRGLDDSTWELLCECWSKNPEDRPSVNELVKKLSERHVTIHEPIEPSFAAKSEMDRIRSSNKVEVHTLMSSQLLIVYLPRRRKRTMISNLIKRNF